MVERALIDGALQIDIAVRSPHSCIILCPHLIQARKRCSEKITELMTALHIILKAGTHILVYITSTYAL